MKRIYRLQLDDYSAASFTSFGKDYFGTLDQMRELFDDIRSDEDLAERFGDILTTFDRYLAGEKKITHYVAYQEVPFLVQAKVLDSAASALTNHFWTHMNTWDWPYYMKCDKAESIHIWVSCHGQYCRCIQTAFSNLQYSTDRQGYESLGGMTWGYPGQIDGMPGEIIRNRLFVMEKTFPSRTEAIADMDSFQSSPYPDFSGILEDIFGDG